MKFFRNSFLLSSLVVIESNHRKKRAENWYALPSIRRYFYDCAYHNAHWREHSPRSRSINFINKNFVVIFRINKLFGICIDVFFVSHSAVSFSPFFPSLFLSLFLSLELISLFLLFSVWLSVKRARNELLIVNSQYTRESAVDCVVVEFTLYVRCARPKLIDTVLSLPNYSKSLLAFGDNIKKSILQNIV